MNILLIDDDIKCLKKITKIIKSASIEYNITTTHLTTEAIELAQKNKVDLIIIDFVIKDVSGICIVQSLQHIKKTKTIPVLFVVKHIDKRFKQYGFEVGSIDYILKPIDPHLLKSRLTLYSTILSQNKLLYNTNKLLRKEIHKEKNKAKLQEHMLVHQSKTSLMGEMIGAIAHQWRQPLNIIATSMINLETKAELEILDLNEIKRINSKINDTLCFLSQTIDDFRNFFLLSEHKENSNLIEVVESTIDIVKAQFTAHNIKINFDYQKDDSFHYLSYYNELRQVLMNILTNSKDAIELKKEKDIEGEINIKLVKKEQSFRISLSDNGGGIDEKIIKKIFNPYFTTKFEDQGTGIGLYMSKTIIEQFHDGKINAYNQNDGCCFEISLFF